MKPGINGADETIPTAPNTPSSGLISAFDTALALIVSPEILLSQLESDFLWISIRYWKVLIVKARWGSVPTRAAPLFWNVRSHDTVERSFWETSRTCLAVYVFSLSGARSRDVCQPVSTH